jgi:hypothetical protein
METGFFSVGYAARLYNKDPRRAELTIGESLETAVEND